MANFYDDMRTSSRFSRPFGMPEMDDSSLGDILRQVSPVVSSMKRDDMLRQQQMMEFENSLRRQNMMFQNNMNRRPLPDPTKKNWVVNYGGPVKLPPSTVEADNAARDAKAAQINKEFAAINEVRNERQATRASAEKIASDNLAARAAEDNAQRKFTAEQNRLNREQKGQPYMMPDPNDPNKQIAVRWNPATDTVEPIKFGEQNVTNLIKPGTPPKTGKFVQPKNLDSIREQTQGALEEIKNIIGEDDELTPEGARAVGKSSIANWIPTTKGYAGSASINRVKSQQVLNLIGELKSQSRTGATGFGNMSNKDLSVLEAAATKLDTGLDEATFKKEIIRIRGLLKKIMEEEAAEQPEPDQPGTRSVGNRPQLDAAKMYDKYSRYGSGRGGR